MKKLLIGLSLTLLSCQAAAITTVAGIDFVDVATNLTDSVGAFYNNTTDIFPNPPLLQTGPDLRIWTLPYEDSEIMTF